MIGGNVYIFKKTQCLQLLLQGTKSTLLPYINDIMLFPEAKFIVLSISTPLESIANIIDLIGIFARPHPYFWTIHKKPWPSKGYKQIWRRFIRRWVSFRLLTADKFISRLNQCTVLMLLLLSLKMLTYRNVRLQANIVKRTFNDKA